MTGRTDATRDGGWNRRRFLRLTVPLPFLAPAVLSACTSDGGSDDGETGTDASRPESSVGSSASTRPATRACGDAEPTLEETEGPFYSNGPPERTNIRDGVGGTNLTVSGQVIDTACTPIAGAILDFWQADDAGNYDNRGYTLRGFQRADDKGRFTLETIVPGIYPGRTRHIHVKVQSATNTPVLTTQLFFPDEPMNASDDIFDATLVMNVAEGGEGERATFDFVLDS
ncbi:MAG: hypothetical protein ACRDWD_01950 [Acidimicrobiia bacterium]